MAIIKRAISWPLHSDEKYGGHAERRCLWTGTQQLMV
jgi:hypothetical protein